MPNQEIVAAREVVLSKMSKLPGKADERGI